MRRSRQGELIDQCSRVTSTATPYSTIIPHSHIPLLLIPHHLLTGSPFTVSLYPTSLLSSSLHHSPFIPSFHVPGVLISTFPNCIILFFYYQASYSSTSHHFSSFFILHPFIPHFYISCPYPAGMHFIFSPFHVPSFPGLHSSDLLNFLTPHFLFLCLSFGIHTFLVFHFHINSSIHSEYFIQHPFFLSFLLILYLFLLHPFIPYIFVSHCLSLRILVALIHIHLYLFLGRWWRRW